MHINIFKGGYNEQKIVYVNSHIIFSCNFFNSRQFNLQDYNEEQN